MAEVLRSQRHALGAVQGGNVANRPFANTLDAKAMAC